MIIARQAVLIHYGPSTGPSSPPKTAVDGLRRSEVPTINFYDDYAAHVDFGEGELTNNHVETPSRLLEKDSSELFNSNHVRRHRNSTNGEALLGGSARRDVRSSDGIPRADDTDPEGGQGALSRHPTVKFSESGDLQAPQDPHLISWSGPDDVDNPKDWPLKKKWGAIAIVSAFTLQVRSRATSGEP